MLSKKLDKWKDERSYIWAVEKDMKTWLIIAVKRTNLLTVVKLKPEKITIQAWTVFEPTTSAIPVQCSTNWAIKPPGSWTLCWVRKIPVEGEDTTNCTWKIIYLNCEERYEDMIDHLSQWYRQWIQYLCFGPQESFAKTSMRNWQTFPGKKSPVKIS